MTGDNKTNRMVVISMMLALEVILSTFFTVNVGGIAKIGFGFLPIAMIAILYGPAWAGATYAVGDIIAYFIKPEGQYFPGLTLTCFLTGILFGLLLYKKEISFPRSVITAAIVVLFMDLLLNTYWLSILYGQAFIGLLPTRIVKCMLSFAAQAVLIPLVWNKVMLKIPTVTSELKLRDQK